MIVELGTREVPVDHELLHREVTPDETGVKLDAMIDMIDSHLDESLTLEAMAKLANVSRAHFVRRFRTVTGLSPHRYITMRRIEKAKQLLLQNDGALSEIGLAVGFANQSHFTQVFHDETGSTPSQYRTLHSSPDSPPRESALRKKTMPHRRA